MKSWLWHCEHGVHASKACEICDPPPPKEVEAKEQTKTIRFDAAENESDNS